jgi:histidinol dehydrogenase
MIRYTQPPKEKWADILQRPAMEAEELQEQVANILERVQQRGDLALKTLTRQFDGVELDQLLVSKEEVEEAKAAVSDDLKAAIQIAYQNIQRFHEAQQVESPRIETMPGVQCWRRSLPIERVGIYIPGGTAPLFSSILMLGVPAKIAGCQEIVLCTPPGKDQSIQPSMLYTADLLGIEKIYKVGGAQAIGAMAYGTESVPKVDKIFGPGNQYVTMAKQLVQQTQTAIDMPAGPSEVLVIADNQSDPAFIAADLLSQAEHGVDSQVVLLTTSEELIDRVEDALEAQLQQLPRQSIARKVMEQSPAIVLSNLDSAMELSNVYAPEHLILSLAQPQELAEKVRHAGSVFLGYYAPESVGDYASGTNHTLPTNGFARAYEGVSLDAFVKKITFQQLSPEGLQNIGPYVEVMASTEQLEAHRLAVSVRLESLKK